MMNKSSCHAETDTRRPKWSEVDRQKRQTAGQDIDARNLDKQGRTEKRVRRTGPGEARRGRHFRLAGGIAARPRNDAAPGHRDTLALSGHAA